MGELDRRQSVGEDMVSFTSINELPGGGTPRRRLDSPLQDRGRVARVNRGDGVAIEDVYGRWNREPVGDGDGELIVVARLRR